MQTPTETVHPAAHLYPYSPINPPGDLTEYAGKILRIELGPGEFDKNSELSGFLNTLEAPPSGQEPWLVVIDSRASNDVTTLGGCLYRALRLPLAVALVTTEGQLDIFEDRYKIAYQPEGPVTKDSIIAENQERKKIAAFSCLPDLLNGLEIVRYRHDLSRPVAISSESTVNPNAKAQLTETLICPPTEITRFFPTPVLVSNGDEMKGPVTVKVVVPSLNEDNDAHAFVTELRSLDFSKPVTVDLSGVRYMGAMATGALAAFAVMYHQARNENLLVHGVLPNVEVELDEYRGEGRQYIQIVRPPLAA